MQMLDARRGVVTAEVREVAKREGVDANKLRDSVAHGRAAIFSHAGTACGIGRDLTTKVNANFGMSPDFADPDDEMKKLAAAVSAGTDTVMDLSIAGDALSLLKRVVRESPVPVGSVPVYTAVLEGKRKGRGIPDLTEDDFLSAIEAHLDAGVNFVTVHAAITREGAALAQKRVLRVVSRGGCFLSAWMRETGKENPYFTHLDTVLDMLAERDVVLSIGDALRPGALADAHDEAQLLELKLQGGIVKKCIAKGVQVICEGPGHMPLNLIGKNVKLQKKLCLGAPYYVLGPLPTDIGVGYDHIVSAMGGAIAAAAGADFLCAVSRSEHAALPTPEDVYEGVVASRLAAHAGDIVKRKGASRDRAMSVARAKLDWAAQFRCALYPEKAQALREARGTKSAGCSMCGEYCAYKIA